MAQGIRRKAQGILRRFFNLEPCALCLPVVRNNFHNRPALFSYLEGGSGASFPMGGEKRDVLLMEENVAG